MKSRSPDILLWRTPNSGRHSVALIQALLVSHAHII